MLHKASALSIYDELLEVEIEAYLKKNPTRFDLIVCSDTLCYFGQLESFFKNAFASMVKDGSLIFTVEASAKNKGNFNLEEHGRYSHSENYVCEAIQTAGLDLDRISSVVLRMEKNTPVEGFLVVATAPI